jgi:uncharacterized coiled-coil protein SlyX
MNDAQTAPSGENPAATEQTTTMADLAAGIPDAAPAPGEGAATPAQKPAAPAAAPAQSDNVTEFQNFVSQQQEATENLAAQLADIADKQNELENSQHREAVNKAVDNAVKRINENVDGDPEMAEYFLSKAYNNDPNLQKIFQNRDQFPEQYEKALTMLNKEWAAKNTTTIDPQVAENQRALKDSQSPGATPQAVDETEEWAKLDDAEFYRKGMDLANNR